MNHRDNALLREKLAAEYVLGTLKGGARRRFEGWMHDDGALRRMAAQWRDRLMPLAELRSENVPPTQLWRRIERGLGLGRRATIWSFRRDDSGAFRPMPDGASTAIVALLWMDMDTHVKDGATFNQVATMTIEDADTALLLIADTPHSVFDARVVGNASLPRDMSMQLWVVAGNGAPRSLGILDGHDVLHAALSEEEKDADAILLVVSLEPNGGSLDPTGPSGPILHRGNWKSLM